MTWQQPITDALDETALTWNEVSDWIHKEVKKHALKSENETWPSHLCVIKDEEDSVSSFFMHAATAHRIISCVTSYISDWKSVHLLLFPLRPLWFCVLSVFIIGFTSWWTKSDPHCIDIRFCTDVEKRAKNVLHQWKGMCSLSFESSYWHYNDWLNGLLCLNGKGVTLWHWPARWITKLEDFWVVTHLCNIIAI